MQPHIAKIIRQKQFLQTTQRFFSLAVEAEKAAEPAEPTLRVSNSFKNQHIRYIPKKRFHFNTATPDGKVALIFEANDKLSVRQRTWAPVLAATLPATACAFYMLPMSQFLMALPLMYTPSFYYIFDAIRIGFLCKSETKRLWLYESGDQILLETFDGVKHKLNIIDNREHELAETKDK